MNPLGSFTSESFLEQGKSMAKKTSDAALQGVKVTAQTAAQQLTGSSFGVADAAAAIMASDTSHHAAEPVADDQFVRELYGAEHNQQSHGDLAHTIQQSQPVAQASIAADEQHKLASTRQQLDMLIKQQHMDSYFNPTFTRRQSQQEESVIEKNEREDQEKRFEDFEKQKKKPDFALQRAKTRTEMSPGASG